MLKKTITYGVFSGIIVTLYYALLYMGGIKIYANWWLAILLFPIVIFLVFYFSVRIKREFPEVVFDYGKAFQTLFIIGAVGSLVALIWNILLFNVINKDLGKNLTERIIEQTMEMMEKFGAPESAIEDSLKEMGNMEEQFKPSGQLLSWLKGLIFYAVLAAIGALIIRKKDKPEVAMNAM